METELKLLREKGYIAKKIKNEEYTLEEYRDDILNDDSRGNELKYVYTNPKIAGDELEVKSGKYKFIITVGGEYKIEKNENNTTEEEEPVNELTELYLKFEDPNKPRNLLDLESGNSNLVFLNKFKSWFYMMSIVQLEEQEAKIRDSLKIKGINEDEILTIDYSNEVEYLTSNSKVNWVEKEEREKRWENYQDKKAVKYLFKNSVIVCFTKGEEANISFDYSMVEDEYAYDYSIQIESYFFKKIDSYLEVKKWGKVLGTYTSYGGGNIETNADRISDKIPELSIFPTGENNEGALPYYMEFNGKSVGIKLNLSITDEKYYSNTDLARRYEHQVEIIEEAFINRNKDEKYHMDIYVSAPKFKNYNFLKGLQNKKRIKKITVEAELPGNPEEVESIRNMLRTIPGIETVEIN